MYAKTVEECVSQSYARELTEEERKNNGCDFWFIPHHPVLNVNKPNKVRVVFDCVAQHHGTSLNQQFLQGPDLLNDLIGVLCRFRKKVALVANIEAISSKGPSKRSQVLAIFAVSR